MDGNKHIKKIIIWGARYQFKVIKPILLSQGFKIELLIDETPNLKNYLGYNVVNSLEDFKKWKKNKKSKGELGFIVCISNPNGKIREKKAKELINLGLKPISIISKSARIANDVKLGKGLQILENVVIHPGSKIGNYCIVLSNSLIDHDCILGKCVELAGGVNLAGRIHIGDYSWLGIGSTVFADQNSEDPRKIGNNCIIGASSLVNKDIPNNYVAYGIPAKKIRKNEK